MGLSQFSETNIENSVATLLAQRLLNAGYLLYWEPIDAVQTIDGWYFQYTTQQATYAVDPVFSQRLAAAKGILTLRDPATANPSFAVRPMNDGTVPEEGAVQTPSLAIHIGPMLNGEGIGMGDRTRVRYRHLSIYGLARDRFEQATLRDSLAMWFDENEVIDVRDHDAETLELFGSVITDLVMADSAIVQLSTEAMTFEVVLNARLQYEA